MYGCVKTNVRLGISLNPMGLKSTFLPMGIYVVLVKSECKAVSNRMCGWGFL